MPKHPSHGYPDPFLIGLNEDAPDKFTDEVLDLVNNPGDLVQDRPTRPETITEALPPLSKLISNARRRLKRTWVPKDEIRKELPDHVTDEDFERYWQERKQGNRYHRAYEFGQNGEQEIVAVGRRRGHGAPRNLPPKDARNVDDLMREFADDDDLNVDEAAFHHPSMQGFLAGFEREVNDDAFIHPDNLRPESTSSRAALMRDGGMVMNEALGSYDSYFEENPVVIGSTPVDRKSALDDPDYDEDRPPVQGMPPIPTRKAQANDDPFVTDVRKGLPNSTKPTFASFDALLSAYQLSPNDTVFHATLDKGKWAVKPGEFEIGLVKDNRVDWFAYVPNKKGWDHGAVGILPMSVDKAKSSPNIKQIKARDVERLAKKNLREDLMDGLGESIDEAFKYNSKFTSYLNDQTGELIGIGGRKEAWYIYYRKKFGEKNEPAHNEPFWKLKTAKQALKMVFDDVKSVSGNKKDRIKKKIKDLQTRIHASGDIVPKDSLRESRLDEAGGQFAKELKRVLSKMKSAGYGDAWNFFNRNYLDPYHKATQPSWLSLHDLLALRDYASRVEQAGGKLDAKWEKEITDFLQYMVKELKAKKLLREDRLLHEGRHYGANEWPAFFASFEGESMGYPKRDNPSQDGVTSKLKQAARAFTQEVEKASEEYFGKNQDELADGASETDFMGAEWVSDVLLTLEGHGAGIWDGDWDHLFQNGNKGVEKMQRFLMKRLSKAHDKIIDTIHDSAYETMGGKELDKNQSAAEKWVNRDLKKAVPPGTQVRSSPDGESCWVTLKFKNKTEAEGFTADLDDLLQNTPDAVKSWDIHPLRNIELNISLKLIDEGKLSEENEKPTVDDLMRKVPRGVSPKVKKALKILLGHRIYPNKKDKSYNRTNMAKIVYKEANLNLTDEEWIEFENEYVRATNGLPGSWFPAGKVRENANEGHVDEGKLHEALSLKKAWLSFDVRDYETKEKVKKKLIAAGFKSSQDFNVWSNPKDDFYTFRFIGKARHNELQKLADELKKSNTATHMRTSPLSEDKLHEDRIDEGFRQGTVTHFEALAKKLLEPEGVKVEFTAKGKKSAIRITVPKGKDAYDWWVEGGLPQEKMYAFQRLMGQFNVDYPRNWPNGSSFIVESLSEDDKDKLFDALIDRLGFDMKTVGGKMVGSHKKTPKLKIEEMSSGSFHLFVDTKKNGDPVVNGTYAQILEKIPQAIKKLSGALREGVNEGPGAGVNFAFKRPTKFRGDTPDFDGYLRVDPKTLRITGKVKVESLTMESYYDAETAKDAGFIDNVTFHGSAKTEVKKELQSMEERFGKIENMDFTIISVENRMYSAGFTRSKLAKHLDVTGEGQLDITYTDGGNDSLTDVMIDGVFNPSRECHSAYENLDAVEEGKAPCDAFEAAEDAPLIESILDAMCQTYLGGTLNEVQGRKLTKKRDWLGWKEAHKNLAELKKKLEKETEDEAVRQAVRQFDMPEGVWGSGTIIARKMDPLLDRVIKAAAQGRWDKEKRSILGILDDLLKRAKKFAERPELVKMEESVLSERRRHLEEATGGEETAQARELKKRLVGKRKSILDYLDE